MPLSIVEQDGRIAVSTPYHPNFPARARMLGGEWDAARRVWMFAAGDEDFLAPIESTYEFYKTIAGPKRLTIYEGQPHGVGDPQLSSAVGDFYADVFAGLPFESGVTVVESGTEKRSSVKDYTPP